MMFGIHIVSLWIWGGKHPFLILHLHSPSEVLELISQNLQNNPSATSSYSQPRGKARWTGQLPWGSILAITVLEVLWPPAEQARLTLAAAATTWV